MGDNEHNGEGCGGTGDRGEESPLDPNLVTAVVDARYRRFVADAPEAARRRAQAGWVVVSALAGTLIAAGALTNLDQEPDTVRVFGLFAVVAWIVTAGLFVHAVSGGFRSANPPADAEIEGTEDFVQWALNDATAEHDEVGGRIKRALRVATAAVVLTVTTIAIVQFTDPAPLTEDALIQLDSGTERSLTELCGRPVPEVIEGAVHTQARGDGTLEVDLAPGECTSEKTEAVLDERKLRYILPK
jgi:hypothetical protein